MGRGLLAKGGPLSSPLPYSFPPVVGPSKLSFRGCSSQLTLGTFPMYKYGQGEPPLLLGAKLGRGRQEWLGPEVRPARIKQLHLGACVCRPEACYRGFLYQIILSRPLRGCLEEQASGGLRVDCERSREREPGRWGAASTEVPQHTGVNISAPPTCFICGLLALLPIQGVSWSFPRETTIPL